MAENNILVVIPTYDEKGNVEPISKAVFDVKPDCHMLFVDDNSPDGTGKILDSLSSADKRIHVLHGDRKRGLGNAYISGFKWALERDYQLIFGMDADFSHDPSEIPAFLQASEEADLVIGSRYVNGIRITNWPLSRLMLSKSAATYVRLITRIPVADPTSGYRCYNRKILESIKLDSILSNGYSFLIEMAHTAWKKGFRIKEIPITFEDRRSGYSKLNLAVFKESFFIVWKLAMRRG